MNKAEADRLSKMAKGLFNQHFGTCKGWEKDNCDSCTLETNGPNYAGWARVYVEAERPIPESWRSAFYDELVSENWLYRKKLEESLHWFGVRWTK